jgi:hypothetical protein
MCISQEKCLACNNFFDKRRDQKQQKFCSLSCSNKYRKIISINKYDLFPSHCLDCNSILSYNNRNNRFCSKSCAAKSNMAARTDEYHNSHSKRMIEYHKNNPFVKLVSKLSQGVCIICQKSFISRHKRKTCSLSCKKELCQINGRKAVAVRCIRSKDEIELYKLCNFKFDNVLSNHIIQDGWDADIVIPMYKLAIMWNGPWHYRSMPVSKHSLLQVQTRDRIKQTLFESIGWTVLVFEDRYYTPLTAFNEIEKLVAASRIARELMTYEAIQIELDLAYCLK